MCTYYGNDMYMLHHIYVNHQLILLSIAVISFELTGGSGSTIQVTESDGSLEVTLALSRQWTGGRFVDFLTSYIVATEITATGLLKFFVYEWFLLVGHLAGEDFGPSKSYPVTFHHGSLRQSVNIPIIDDNVYEFDETFQLEIISSLAVAYGVIDGCGLFAPSVTVVCTDDDCKFFR